MFSSIQKIALLMGLPLLYLLGMRLDKGNGRYVVRDAAGAFAVLCVIVAAFMGALWTELGMRWPVAVAVVYLALLASVVLKKGGPQVPQPSQEGGAKPEA